MNRPQIDRLELPNSKTLQDPRVRHLLSPQSLEALSAEEKETPQSWNLSTFSGRLGEISGTRDSATLTLTFHIVRDAQRCGESVVWIARKESIFYPPDVAELSVDLEALNVVWAGSPRLATKAADQLVRSGGFGLVVLDLGANANLPLSVLSRLAGLVKKHRAALLFLTEKGPKQNSLGSLISIRMQTQRTRKDKDLFLCRAQAVKDKRIGPGWVHEEIGHGPDGVC